MFTQCVAMRTWGKTELCEQCGEERGGIRGRGRGSRCLLYGVTAGHLGWAINPRSVHGKKREKGKRKGKNKREKKREKKRQRLVEARREPSYTCSSTKISITLAKRWDLSSLMWHSVQLSRNWILPVWIVTTRSTIWHCKLGQVELMMSGCAVSASLGLAGPFAQRKARS